MKLKEISLKSSKEEEFIEITDKIIPLVAENMNDGILTLFSPHTTGGITINENADPDVREDMTSFFARTIADDPRFNHIEGNSSAHIKTSLMGNSLTIPVKDGKMVTGIWQGIYFCEFDGPRNRKIIISMVEA